MDRSSVWCYICNRYLLKSESDGHAHDRVDQTAKFAKAYQQLDHKREDEQYKTMIALGTMLLDDAQRRQQPKVVGPEVENKHTRELISKEIVVHDCDHKILDEYSIEHKRVDIYSYCFSCNAVYKEGESHECLTTGLIYERHTDDIQSEDYDVCVVCEDVYEHGSLHICPKEKRFNEEDVKCPICGKEFGIFTIEKHASTCSGPSEVIPIRPNRAWYINNNNISQKKEDEEEQLHTRSNKKEL